MIAEEMQAPAQALKAEVPIHQVREVAAVQEVLSDARNRDSPIDLETTFLFLAQNTEETPLEAAADVPVAAPPAETPGEIAVEVLVVVPAPAPVEVLPPAPAEVPLAPVEVPVEGPIEAPVETPVGTVEVFIEGPIEAPIETSMLIGNAEDEATVEQARQNYKLWHRVDLRKDYDPQEERYRAVLAQKDRLMYPGLAEELENDVQPCDKCVYRKTYGTIDINEFGGVKLCEDCEDTYIRYSETLPDRAVKAFPELLTHTQFKVKK